MRGLWKRPFDMEVPMPTPPPATNDAWLDDVLARIRQDAGNTVTPAHDRLLADCLRRLRRSGDAELQSLGHELCDAAQRALEASDPTPTLLELDMLAATLRRALRRQPDGELKRAA
ncbi:hypothetical protein MASR1M8_05400 [Thermomonas brevis]